MADQARLFFNQLEITQRWSFTFQDGEHPSTCSVSYPPHIPVLDPVGDLVITYGGRQLRFVDCCLQEPRVEAGMGGQMVTLNILDRRWKWAFAFIRGSFNHKNEDGTLVRVKTPQELLTMLLEACGESSINVSSVPNEMRPECNWGTDVSCQAEIGRLCQLLGCVVVIDSDGSRQVQVIPIGQGGNLPNSPSLGGGLTLSGKPTPDSFLVACQRTVYEAIFDTEAVGLETDGTWVPIDQLSYTPTVDGEQTWQYEDPNEFQNVAEEDRNYTDWLTGFPRKCLDLAKASVFRSFRATGLRGQDDWKPREIESDDAALVPESFDDLELLSTLAVEVVNPATEEKVRPPFRVYGSWFSEEGDPFDPDDEEGNVGGEWPYGKSLDTKQGIVTLSQPAYKIDESDPVDVTYQPAHIQFQTAFHAGHEKVWNRYGRQFSTGLANETPELIVTRTDLELHNRQGYTLEGTVSDPTHNQSSIDQELQYTYDNLIQEFQIQQGISVPYQEIVEIQLDGLISQVTWSGGTQPASTKVSIGRGHNPYTPSLKDLRRKKSTDTDRAIVELARKDRGW